MRDVIDTRPGLVLFFVVVLWLAIFAIAAVSGAR